jgi:hypothetical protein
MEKETGFARFLLVSCKKRRYCFLHDLVQLVIFAVKAHEANQFNAGVLGSCRTEKIRDQPRGFRFGKAVYAGADIGERDAFERAFARKAAVSCKKN